MVQKQDRRKQEEVYGTISNEEWNKMVEETLRKDKKLLENSRRSKSATWTPSAHSSDIGIDQELIQPLVVESDNGLDAILVRTVRLLKILRCYSHANRIPQDARESFLDLREIL